MGSLRREGRSPNRWINTSCFATGPTRGCVGYKQSYGCAPRVDRGTAVGNETNSQVDSWKDKSKLGQSGGAIYAIHTVDQNAVGESVGLANGDRGSSDKPGPLRHLLTEVHVNNPPA